MGPGVTEPGTPPEQPARAQLPSPWRPAAIPLFLHRCQAGVWLPGATSEGSWVLSPSQAVSGAGSLGAPCTLDLGGSFLGVESSPEPGVWLLRGSLQEAGQGSSLYFTDGDRRGPGQ